MHFSRLFLLGLVTFGAASAASPKLDKRFQEWLNGPPSLLITRTERAGFLNLGTDQDRDAFIERFWETRNPAPGSGQNAFQEEFYRRVAYVNAHFGPNSGTTDGWRTDMGKTWVLFGKPKLSREYRSAPQLKDIQLWFYANPGLTELPSFFYVLFFDRDDVSGYRLYHPYVDGPQRLVRSGASNAQAYEAIREVSAELAHASLSLIPGEPVDTGTFSGSMSSARILNAIQGYREMPSYVATITARAQRLARVTSRITYDLPQAGLLAFVVFERGEPWVHWQLEINDPSHPKAAAGRIEYRIQARLYANGQLVFERSDAPSFAAPPGPADELNRRPFVYEDRLAVAPGTYRLVVNAENLASGRTYDAVREVEAPAADEPLAMSDILVLADRTPDARPRPFGFGGVKFEPTAAGIVRPPRGLSVFYQVRFADPRPEELSLEYVLGNVGSKFRKTFEEKLDPRQADASGSLLVSKTLSLEDASPGSYQLVVRLKDPRDGKLTARSTHVLISAGDDAQPIVVARGGAETTARAAANEYERALCWLAQDRPAQAIPLLEASWSATRNPAIHGLLELLYEQTRKSSRTTSQTTEGK